MRGEGIDRRRLPSFLYVTKLQGFILDSLVELAEKSPGNDLGTDRYDANATLRLDAMKPAQYRQVLLQHLADGGDKYSDFGYSVDGPHMGLLDGLRTLFPTMCRARLAFLPAGTELGWHIDTNTSVACRIHVALSGSHMDIERDGRVESRDMAPGEVWFTNTGWRHRVVNSSGVDRAALLFSCRSSDVARFVPGLPPLLD